MTNIGYHLGASIKRFLEKKGSLQVKEFANLMGVSEQHIHKIFKKKELSSEILQLAAINLGVEVCDFFELDSGPKITVEAHKKEVDKLNKKIQDYEKRLMGSVDYYDVEQLERDIFNKATKGQGVCFLKYNIDESRFIVKFKKLENALSKEDFGTYMAEANNLKFKS
jgi:transcriptional regulator with XRE-family HTH domain